MSAQHARPTLILFKRWKAHFQKKKLQCTFFKFKRLSISDGERFNGCSVSRVERRQSSSANWVTFPRFHWMTDLSGGNMSIFVDWEWHLFKIQAPLYSTGSHVKSTSLGLLTTCGLTAGERPPIGIHIPLHRCTFYTSVFPDKRSSFHKIVSIHKEGCKTDFLLHKTAGNWTLMRIPAQKVSSHNKI